MKLDKAKSTPGNRTPSDDADSNPSKSRREFLFRSSVWAAAAASAAPLQVSAAANNAVPDWTRYLGASVDDFAYGVPSPHEAHVARRGVEWLTATRQSSVNFTPIHELDGFVTPNGVCFERHHAGAADVDPAAHRLVIHGMVERPLSFDVETLRRFPPVNAFYVLECAANTGMEWRGAQLSGCQYTHGMVHCVQYTGVPLKTLLAEAGLGSDAAWILAEGADSAAMTRSIPLEKALDDCLVAYAMNGEALRREQGYPIRLVVPGWEGNTWVKWLRRLEVGDKAWYHREETSKYTDLMADGKARIFSWEMDAKSVITQPSPQKPVADTGFNVIQGLAWSGRGRVTQVDVSLDGGRNWAPARLAEPILPKCLTRFYFDWKWDGSEQLLQSRVRDETGYVQPTMAALQEERGVNSVYHNNAIQTWLVRADGAVENVRLGRA